MILVIVLFFTFSTLCYSSFYLPVGFGLSLFNKSSVDEFLSIDTITTLNPVFNWKKINNAIKYQFIIKEYENYPNEKSITIVRTFELKDTFFVVPDLIIQEGKFYSWNIRYFDGRNWSKLGDEFYFKVNLKYRKIEPEPITLYPGKYSPEVEVIKTLNPVFKWLKYKESTGYELIIFEDDKDGKTKKIFSEVNFGLIKDTFFVLKGNLLKTDVKYSWQIRSKLLNKFSPLSEKRYFKIILPKKLIIPEPIYPGYKIENQEIVATTTPTLIWKKIPDAESYSIAISKKDLDGKYKLIYDTERLMELKDTLFILPEGVLENNSSYRWNIKVNLKDGRSVYSKRLYFNVSIFETQKFDLPKIEIERSEDIEEILLTLEYAGLVKSFIQAVAYNDKIFISLTELLSNFMIPYSVKDDKLIESKSEDVSNFFIIDFNKNKAKNNQGEFEIKDIDWIEHLEQKYFSLEFLEKLLSINLEFDFSNLILYVKSDRTLPIYNEYLLKQKLSSLRRVQKEESLPLLFKRKRSLLNGFIFDYNVSQILLRNQKSNFNLITTIGGEILYGDFYYSRQLFKTTNTKSIIENFNWKYTPDPNNILTQLTLGDDFIDGINSYTYRGIKITNEPIEPRKKLGAYIYRDIIDPNSYIELYLNNELIDITKSDDKGIFSFEFPIGYGMSIYEFKIHTLKGETKSFRKLYHIPNDLLPEGIFNYQFTYGKLQFTENKLANIELKYGVKDYLTMNAGSEFISDRINRYLNFFGKSSIRASSNLFLNVLFSPKIQTKISANYTRPDYASSYFEFVNYKPHKFYNIAKLKNSLKGSLYFPIKLKASELGLYFNYESINYETSKRKFLNFSTYYLYKWFSLSGSLNFENNWSPSLNRIRFLTLGSTLNFNNILTNVPILNKSYLSTKTNYDLLKNKIFSYSFFYTTTFTKNLRFQINYERLISIKTSNINLSMFLELPQFKYLSNSNGRDLYNHQLSGSIGFSPEVNQFYFYSEPQVGRAAIYIQGFEDENENGLKEKNEKNIVGLDFTINSVAYSSILDNDTRIFFGLNPYQEYSVKLNEINLKTINYSCEFSEFNLLTDGNRLKVIQLPYYETGEIGGIVTRYFENEELPLSNVKLVIRNQKTGKKYLISTFSDGSFYFYGLPKGIYEIEVDKELLEKISLESYPEKIEFEISSKQNQLILENLKFVLR